MRKILFCLLSIVLCPLSLFAQLTVQGTVVDQSGEPVIGATVVLEGTTIGTVTDFDGNFTLETPADAMITVSYVGYKSQTLAVLKQMNIVLSEDSEVLEDVVVIGYGVAKKNDMTGSVTALKPDEKNRGMVTSAQDMIQGKIAGVNVNTASGEPGAGAQIRIRGGASLNASNDPLIVIDGMPMDNSTAGTNNPLALVNPNDIESFTVLKDASATAIYGSRGSNGVIIITTKKGAKNQAPKVSYNGTFSLSTISKKLDVMTADEYRDYIKTTYGESSAAYKGLGDANTDWQKEIFRLGLSHDHNVSLSGGYSDSHVSMPYRVSLGYTGQEGVLKGSDYRRFTGGFSLNPSFLKDHLTFNINGKYAWSRTNGGGQSAIDAAFSMDPTRPVMSDDPAFKNWGGYWQWIQSSVNYDPTFPYEQNGAGTTNPVELIAHNPYDKSANILIGNIEIDYKIHGFEDLRLHANFAGEYSKGGEYTNKSPYSSYGFYYGGKGESVERKYNLLTTAYAQYYKDFTEDHHFDVMAGYEYSKNHREGDSWNKTWYPATALGMLPDGVTPAAGHIKDSTTYHWAGQTILVSWFGRANYTLLNRFMFTATVRADGSSRFAKGHQWGIFPSAAFAWRISDEPWMRDVQQISDLKLRLGWGQTGQQDTGRDYYTQIYNVSTGVDRLYPIGPDNDGILYRPAVYNDDLTWETTSTWNLGIDFGMFQQRLTLNVDMYKRNTTNLLCTPTIPAGMNYDNKMMLNAGELENMGIEFAVVGRPVQTKDWFLELGVNAAYNHNVVKKLYGGRDMIEAGMTVGMQKNVTYHKVGQPANSFWVYQQVYDENGRPIQGLYVDRNGDGNIDDNDRYFYKSIAAPWTGGGYIKLSYKNWDLGTNLRFSIGNYVYNNIVQSRMNTDVLYNPSKGTYTNSTKDIIALGWTSYEYPLTDYLVQNASFFKCDNITLGYNFDKAGKTDTYEGISGRVYLSCSNVFTLTKYKGIDPEQPGGIENSIYPRSRTFLVGLNLNF